MKAIVKILFTICSLIFIFYLFLPNPDFPDPPPDALQSNEPADTETSLRRAYFTNYNRQEVLAHYQKQLTKSNFLGFLLPTYRLNYPPEEAQTLIRDQTRSTFLEEIVHPLRESFFVNGFEPKDPKDAILIEEKNWRQKITVRLVPSNTLARLAVSLAALFIIYLISNQYLSTLIDFRKK